MPDGKIALEDIIEATTAGVLRGMGAREVAAERLVASGFTVRLDLTAGGRLSDLFARTDLPEFNRTSQREIG